MGRAQTAQEENWNVATHGIGVFLFLAFSIYYVFSDYQTDYFNLKLGTVIYFVSQVFLYTASTAYHYVIPGKLKFKLRKADHIAIYLSIAGTYTPICLSVLWDSNGPTILIAVWSIALFGTIWKLFFTGKFEAFSSLLYLVMGWLVVLDIDTVTREFSEDQLTYLIAGGVFFTVGIVFYAWNKLYFNHVIWHLFVLAGSFSHYLLVFTL